MIGKAIREYRDRRGFSRECSHRNKRTVIIHLEDDPGYETEHRDCEDPEDEGMLYDNLD